MTNRYRILCCMGCAGLLMMAACGGGYTVHPSIGNDANSHRLSEIVCQADNMPFLKDLRNRTTTTSSEDAKQSTHYHE